MSVAFLILAIILGWLIGCFINYASDVLPLTRRFSPAVCANCQGRTTLQDYILLRSCRACGQKRAVRAWAVQILATAGAIALAVHPHARLGFWLSLVLLAFFGVVVVIDLEHRLILHPVSLAGAALGAGIGLWLHGWLATLIGGMAGFGIMLALYYLGYLFAKGLGRLRGESIDEEALGFGDVNLSGVLGLLLGWPGIGMGLIFAILLGGAGSLLVMVVMALAKRYRLFQAIPYGPFLIAGATVVLLLK